MSSYDLPEGATISIQYGSMPEQVVAGGQRLIVGSHQQQPTLRRLRNRMGDVMEHELTGDSMDDCMPEVQWRPPPRSMRGKRKLVRYTVILVSVSFTCK